MLKKLMILTGLLLLIPMATVFAGIEWQSKTATSTGEKQNIMLVHAYAQDGNVKQEFVKGMSNPLMKEGSYMLFLKGSSIIYLVNPKEKTYSEFPLDAMMQMAGSMMQMTITNAKVDVKQLPAEKILNYACNHARIESSYDMEMKMMGFQIKNHTEQSNEMWGTTAIADKELSPLFKSMNLKTGMKELDALIEKQVSVIKDLGFPIKSVMVTKTTDQKGKVTTITAETTVSEIVTKSLSASLFEIPKDYEKTSLLPTMPPVRK